VVGIARNLEQFSATSLHAFIQCLGRDTISVGLTDRPVAKGEWHATVATKTCQASRGAGDEGSAALDAARRRSCVLIPFYWEIAGRNLTSPLSRALHLLYVSWQCWPTS
jgi:hypothetical protein